MSALILYLYAFSATATAATSAIDIQYKLSTHPSLIILDFYLTR
jgi:hypothetical protein